MKIREVWKITSYLFKLHIVLVIKNASVTMFYAQSGMPKDVKIVYKFYAHIKLNKTLQNGKKIV